MILASLCQGHLLTDCDAAPLTTQSKPSGTPNIEKWTSFFYSNRSVEIAFFSKENVPIQASFCLCEADTISINHWLSNPDSRCLGGQLFR